MAQAEAEAMAALGLEEKGAVVVTAQEGWHPGVVGLVAARLKERYGRPAFAIALGARAAPAPARAARSPASISAARCAAAVREGLLIKGGGHAMAAGVTLRKDALARVPRLPRRGAGARRRSGAARDARSRSTARSAPAAPNVELVELLARAGPFGAGNPEPVLALPAHMLAYADPVGENHVRARFKSGDGAIRQRDRVPRRRHAARQGVDRATAAAPCTPPAAFAIDRWQGEERVQMRLIDVAVPA